MVIAVAIDLIRLLVHQADPKISEVGQDSAHFGVLRRGGSLDAGGRSLPEIILGHFVSHRSRP
jgi:hypothetical protein